MSDRRDELEKYEFMMGPARGKLAVSLDMLTDALILVGQHGVYCASQRNPSKPALDIQTVVSEISGAKQLIQSVMEQLEQERVSAPPPDQENQSSATSSPAPEHTRPCSPTADAVACGCHGYGQSRS